MYQKETGKRGEDFIKRYLIGKDYEILEDNYHARVGEIDIIAFDQERSEIVFVEVKTRKTMDFGRPEDAVSPSKIKKIEKAALRWLQKNRKEDIMWRIDIIALELIKSPKITHLENVTL